MVEMRMEHDAELSNWITQASLAIIILFPLLSIFQGIDFTDMGFSLFNYQNMFNPDIPTSYEMVFLTDLTGAVWLKLFDSWGAVSIKLLFLLNIWLVNAGVYFFFRKYMSRSLLLPALAVTTLIVAPEMQWFNYNTATQAVFCFAGMAVIRSGLGDRKLLSAFAAAFMLTVGVFFRMPNIMGFLLLLLPFMVLFDQESAWIKLFSGYFLGVLAGLAAVFLVLEISGKRTELFAQLQGLMQHGDSGSSHGIGRLLGVQLRDFGKSIAGVLLLAGAFSAGTMLTRKYASKMRSLSAAVMGAGLFFLFFALPSELFRMKTGVRIIDFPTFITGILLCVVFIEALKSWRNPSSYFTLAVSVLILMLIPFGSNRGYKNTVFGMWLILPLAVDLLYRKWLQERGRFRRLDLPAAGRFLLIVVVFLSCYNAATYIYRDSGCRLNKTSTMTHPALKGILTSPERAAAINGLTAQLQKYDLAGKQVLAYECIPMVHYLTASTPFLEHHWPMLLAPAVIKARLKVRSLSNSVPVLVVRAKYQARIASWPVIDRIGKRYHRRKSRQQRVLLNGFVKESGFKTVWTNNFFEVLAR